MTRSGTWFSDVPAAVWDKLPFAVEVTDKGWSKTYVHNGHGVRFWLDDGEVGRRSHAPRA